MLLGATGAGGSRMVQGCRMGWSDFHDDNHYNHADDGDNEEDDNENDDDDDDAPREMHSPPSLTHPYSSFFLT